MILRKNWTCNTAFHTPAVIRHHPYCRHKGRPLRLCLGIWHVLAPLSHFQRLLCIHQVISAQTPLLLLSAWETPRFTKRGDSKNFADCHSNWQQSIAGLLVAKACDICVHHLGASLGCNSCCNLWCFQSLLLYAYMFAPGIAVLHINILADELIKIALHLTRCNTQDTQAQKEQAGTDWVCNHPSNWKGCAIQNVWAGLLNNVRQHPAQNIEFPRVGVHRTGAMRHPVLLK